MWAGYIVATIAGRQRIAKRQNERPVFCPGEWWSWHWHCKSYKPHQIILPDAAARGKSKLKTLLSKSREWNNRNIENYNTFLVPIIAPLPIIKTIKGLCSAVAGNVIVVCKCAAWLSKVCWVRVAPLVSATLMITLPVMQFWTDIFNWSCILLATTCEPSIFRCRLTMLLYWILPLGLWLLMR